MTILGFTVLFIFPPKILHITSFLRCSSMWYFTIYKIYIFYWILVFSILDLSTRTSRFCKCSPLSLSLSPSPFFPIMNNFIILRKKVQSHTWSYRLHQQTCPHHFLGLTTVKSTDSFGLMKVCFCLGMEVVRRCFYDNTYESERMEERKYLSCSMYLKEGEVGRKRGRKINS